MAESTFEWYDWLLFAGVMVTSFVIGLVFACTGGRQRTTAEYLSGNRALGVLPVTLSIYMSATSGITVLSNAAEMYTHGVQMWLSLPAYSIASIVGGVIFIPMFYKLRLTSSFEYLELRYQSVAVRKLGSVLSIISGLMLAGLALYTPATSLEAVTPIPMWATIVALGVIGTLYTTLGGIKAVVWTDAFQGIAMFVSVLAICILGVQEVGDIDEIWDVCKENERVWVTFDPNPMVRMSFWSVIFGNIFIGMQQTGTSQLSVMRYSAMKSEKHAFLAVMLCVPMHILIYTLSFIAGGSMFTYYHKAGCDPLRSGQVSNTNQLLSFFVLNGLKKPALPGLLTALLVSGALSSVTSTMNGNAAVTWKDFLEGCGPFKNMTERGKTITTKVLCREIHLTVHCHCPPLFGMFVLAAFFPFTTPVGVIVGAVCGFAMHITVGLGNSLYNPWPLTLNTSVDTCGNLTINDDMLYGSSGVPSLFHMSYQWYEAWGTVVTVVVGILVSLVSGTRSPSAQDPRYLISLSDRLCCCLSLACRKRFWCAVRHEEVDHDRSHDTVGLEGEYYTSFGDKIYALSAPVGTTNEDILVCKNKMDVLADEILIKCGIPDVSIIENRLRDHIDREEPAQVTHL